MIGRFLHWLLPQPEYRLRYLSHRTEFEAWITIQKRDWFGDWRTIEAEKLPTWAVIEKAIYGFTQWQSQLVNDPRVTGQHPPNKPIGVY